MEPQREDRSRPVVPVMRSPAAASRRSTSPIDKVRGKVRAWRGPATPSEGSSAICAFSVQELEKLPDGRQPPRP